MIPSLNKYAVPYFMGVTPGTFKTGPVSNPKWAGGWRKDEMALLSIHEIDRQADDLQTCMADEGMPWKTHEAERLKELVKAGVPAEVVERWTQKYRENRKIETC